MCAHIKNKIKLWKLYFFPLNILNDYLRYVIFWMLIILSLLLNSNMTHQPYNDYLRHPRINCWTLPFTYDDTTWKCTTKSNAIILSTKEWEDFSWRSKTRLQEFIFLCSCQICFLFGNIIKLLILFISFEFMTEEKIGRTILSSFIGSKATQSLPWAALAPIKYHSALLCRVFMFFCC